MIVVPDPPACQDMDEAALIAALRPLLAAFAQTATGSSTKVQRLVLLDAPLSLDHGEVTDKGSVNQRAVLKSRADLVSALYAAHPSANIVTL